MLLGYYCPSSGHLGTDCNYNTAPSCEQVRKNESGKTFSTRYISSYHSLSIKNIL